MESKIRSVNNSSYIVTVSNYLSFIDKKVLTDLYLPIIGNVAFNIYLALYKKIIDNSFESDIEAHEELLRMLNLKDKEFVEERIKLEALGLLETKINDNMFLYNVLMPLNGDVFLNDFVLKNVLLSKIGKDELAKIQCEYLIRKVDSISFKNITHSFDEVFTNTAISCVKNSTNNGGILIQNNDFDMNQFRMLVEMTNMVKPECLNDFSFIDEVIRLSYLFGLSPDDMKIATIKSVDSFMEVDINKLRINVQKIYDSKNSAIKVEPVKVSSPKSNDAIIENFEKYSPSIFFSKMTKTSLIPSDIAMINDLIVETGYSVGVINVCLFYVNKTKNGEFPSKNYFLKILNTWKRANVESTKDAFDYIQGSRNAEPSKKHVSSNSKKVVKDTPEWYEDYQKGVEPPSKGEMDSQTIEEIEEFFKPQK